MLHSPSSGRRQLVKLIIQIPCLNEEEALPATIADLPREVYGFDVVEFLVIDDGSTDRTVEVAKECGVHHIVQMEGNQGLARAFMKGLDTAIDLGADVVVNTDADNQYRAEDIPTLTAPILTRDADIVIGARPIATISHFSLMKRMLQKLGSRVVRAISGTQVIDAPSGFRAFSRDAALRLNVFDGFTYTIETIIQAGLSGLRIINVPIQVNGPTRPSRLFKSTIGYMLRSVFTMLGVYVIYRPTRLFGGASAMFFVLGSLLAIRYLYFFTVGDGAGHIQSVIASGVFAGGSLFMLSLAITAHLLGINRRLLEEVRYLERSSRARSGYSVSTHSIANESHRVERSTFSE